MTEIGTMPCDVVAAAVYIETAVLCAMAVRRRRDRVIVGLVTATLLLLGLNHLLHLGGVIGAAGRSLAIADGWYADRRLVQMLTLAGLLGVAGGAAMVAAVGLRRRVAVRFAACGLVLLVCVQAVRSLSLHQLDDLLARGIAGLPLGWLVELTGLAVISAAAAIVLRTQRPSIRATTPRQ